MAARSASGTTPNELRALLPGAVRALAQPLRRPPHARVPGVAERAGSGWASIHDHDARSGCFRGILPRPPVVRRPFEHGAALPDPRGLLTAQARRTAWMGPRPGGAALHGGIAERVEAALPYRAVR